MTGTAALEVGGEQIDPSRIRPLPGRILIRRILKAEKTVGGIVLTQKSRGISMLGVVVACGAKVDNLRMGDMVIFSIYTASPCAATDPADDNYVFSREDEVFAVIEQGAADSGS